MTKSISRREFFLKSMITGSSAFFAKPDARAGILFPKNKVAAGRVVSIRDNSVRTSKNSLNPDVVENMLNTAMSAFFSVGSAAEAWAGLFSENDVVGIKVNCLAGRGMSTSQTLVDAIVKNLLAIGIPARQIIIWDRANDDLKRAGYKIQTSKRDVLCYGNDHAGYTRQLYESGSIGSFLSNILVHQCTAIINVPIMKDHGIVGITNALKNFFGAIHNPNKYHSFKGDPYIADVNLLPDIRNKVRLTICDALTSQYEGGPPYMPQWCWQHNGVIVAQDMVAMDSIAWNIIDGKRAEKGMPSLKEAGREPTYIRTAADADHKLGICEPNAIDLIEI
ncbi:DUF362 domain-containing protein [candidate division KSB1 bacterium]|nr:DUF362 domain-containing protein [candidate division KSB1 bacterium]